MKKLGIWQVGNGRLERLEEVTPKLEKDLESWIEEDPNLLQTGVAIIGRQVRLECGTLDLLGIDVQGRLVIVEIKRDTLDRKTITQVIDYAACISELTTQELREKVQPYLDSRKLDLDEILEQRSATDLLTPENRQMNLIVVGTGEAPGMERVIKFLAGKHDLPISVVLLNVFQVGKTGLLLGREVAEPEVDLPDVSKQKIKVSVESVLEMAKKNGIFGELNQAVKLARKLGLGIRPWKYSLMFTPPTHGARMLFTLWAKPNKDGIKAFVGIDPFVEFFSFRSADVAKKLGTQGWRSLDSKAFSAFLKGLESLGIRERMEEMADAD